VPREVMYGLTCRDPTKATVMGFGPSIDVGAHVGDLASRPSEQLCRVK
jgi:hypothetical protein